MVEGGDHQCSGHQAAAAATTGWYSYFSQPGTLCHRPGFPWQRPSFRAESLTPATMHVLQRVC